MKNKNQLSFDFTTQINKPWWMGIVCKPLHYFDLLSQGCDVNDLMKTWEIEDYLTTKIKIK